MNYILTFLAVFVADIIWAKYIQKVANEKRLWASIYAVLLYFTAGFAIIQFTNNPWHLIPASLGAFAGTFVGMLDIDFKKYFIEI